MAGPIRWGSGKNPCDGDASMSSLNTLVNNQDNLDQDSSPNLDFPFQPSPSSNPHAGYHPSSYGPNFSFSAAALGASSSNGSSDLGMSISPPHWAPGNAAWGTSGSFVGSLGTLGASFGRERDRELEAKYVKEFMCCGKRLNGMHDLLEHYEEEHANLPPDVRMAAINAAQSGLYPASSVLRLQSSQNTMASGGRSQAVGPSLASGAMQHQQTDGDAPTPPGMMDIEMEDPQHLSASSAFLQMPQPQPTSARTTGFTTSPSHSPWAIAFRPLGTSTPPHGVPPSLLSFAPPSSSPGPSPASLTPEQVQARAMKKAQRKLEKAAAREEVSASDAEGDKRFPCPIPGCGKVYKQANGLKYHLTRSINSGHGNVAAMGGLAGLLGEKGSDAEG